MGVGGDILDTERKGGVPTLAIDGSSAWSRVGERRFVACGHQYSWGRQATP